MSIRLDWHLQNAAHYLWITHACRELQYNWASLVRAETRQTLRYICMYYITGMKAPFVHISIWLKLWSNSSILSTYGCNNANTNYNSQRMLLYAIVRAYSAGTTLFTELNRYRLIDLNLAFITVIMCRQTNCTYNSSIVLVWALSDSIALSKSMLVIVFSTSLSAYKRSCGQQIMFAPEWWRLFEMLHKICQFHCGSLLFYKQVRSSSKVYHKCRSTYLHGRVLTTVPFVSKSGHNERLAITV